MTLIGQKGSACGHADAVASCWPLWITALVVLSAIACGEGPAGPTPPAGPRIVCPASQTAQSLDGQPVTVAFPQPTVTGGAPPVATKCTHESGGAFGVGTTNVGCTARDARQQVDSCAFQITVEVPPRISATRFLAFGDSITYGSSGACVRSFGGQLLDWPGEDLRSLWANVVAGSYPSVLQNLLQTRYAAQSPVVTNEGAPGERVTNSDTLVRLTGKLAEHAPEVLLLQEGVNDLHSLKSPGIPEIVDGLRALAREARARGARVFIGTLLPERAGSCRAYHPDLIAPANDQIRAMVAGEDATLVDLYEAFRGQEGTLLGEDGLHPSAAGYAKIAETFFATIRQRLEVGSLARNVR